LWSNNYDRRGELQSSYPKYTAMESSTTTGVPAAKLSMSARL